MSTAARRQSARLFARAKKILPGGPRSVAADTLVARYNDLGSVERILRRHRDRVAALIVEPVAGNMGVVLPEAGFLRGCGPCATSTARSSSSMSRVTQ